jgi:hypothetical protein
MHVCTCLGVCLGCAQFGQVPSHHWRPSAVVWRGRARSTLNEPTNQHCTGSRDGTPMTFLQALGFRHGRHVQASSFFGSAGSPCKLICTFFTWPPLLAPQLRFAHLVGYFAALTSPCPEITGRPVLADRDKLTVLVARRGGGTKILKVLQGRLHQSKRQPGRKP